MKAVRVPGALHHAPPATEELTGVLAYDIPLGVPGIAPVEQEAHEGQKHVEIGGPCPAVTKLLSM